ncbi:MAG: hypothetical protein AAF847_14805 [Bacteroidota bacterium]
MKNLIEISKIVTKKKIRKIEIFDDHYLENKSSKFNEFYEALMQGKFKTDRDAAEFLYDSTPKDDKYRQLKSRFRKRLLNTLFFLDVNRPAASNYDRAYYSCNKDWTLVKILVDNDADYTAGSLARQILTTALKFKFADIIVNCCRILRAYAAEEGDDKSFEEYDQHIKQYTNILDAEIRSEELYQRVILNYYKPPSKRTNLSEKIDTYCEALDGLAKLYDSPVILYNKYLMWAFRHEMLHEFDKMLKVCEEAETYVQNNPIYYQADKIASIYLKKLAAYLHLKDEKGLAVTNQQLVAFPRGSDHWYRFSEYLFLLAMHIKNYDKANEIYTDVTSFARFKKADQGIQKKWSVFNFYLSYVKKYLHTDKEGEPIVKSTLRVNKFMEEAALYPKTERILMVHHIIVQILFLMEENRFSKARKLILQLKGHINRQLRKEEYFRTIQFIRLLQQLQKANFEVSSLSNTEKYLLRIREEEPFFYRGLLMEIEIIPYENIWEIILERLSSK